MSFASTLNTAANPPAWIGDSSGRSFRSGLVQQPASAFFAVLSSWRLLVIHYYTISM